jgi:HD superfamily phosphohydrolase
MRFATDYPDAIHGIVRLDRAEQPFIADFESEFLRLDQIDQLGLVGQVFRSAKYPKLEHTFGFYHLIATNGASIPALKGKDAKTLMLVARRAALAHDFGHLPLTYATESGLAQAAACTPAIFKTVSSWIDEVRALVGCDQCFKVPLAHLIGHDHMRLHRWIGAWKLIQRRAAIVDWQERWSVNDEQFVALTKALVCVHDSLAGTLRRVDPMDYVPRDFLRSALGTFAINLSAAMQGLGDTETAETEFITLTGNYLAQRLYGDPKVALLERLVSKLVASLLSTRKLNVRLLTQMTDEQLESKLNNHGLADVPTLTNIIGQVIDGDWFLIDEITGMPSSVYSEIDDALGDLLQPFRLGLVAVPSTAAKQPGLLYGNKKSSHLDRGVTQLLTAVSAPKAAANHGEEMKAWARPLALRCAVSLIAPGETVRVDEARLVPVLRRATLRTLSAMETSPDQIVKDAVESYDKSYPPDDTSVHVEVGGVAVRSIRNRFISECYTAIVTHAISPNVDPWATPLERLILHNPQLLPVPLIQQLANTLRDVRDDPNTQLSVRSVAAELREFYLEHLECGETEWAFPPGAFYGAGPSPLREADGIRIRLAENGPEITLSEITLADSEEKAMSDASKVAKLVGTARRRGIKAVLQRVSQTDMAPHRALR